MEQALRTAGLQATTRQALHLHIDSDTFTLEGCWRIETNQSHTLSVDFHNHLVSFNHFVNIDNVNNLIYPDDVDAVKRHLDELQQGNEVHFSIRIITPGGHIKILTGSASLTKVNNHEDHYRSLFDATDECFCIVKVIPDMHGRVGDCMVLECNPAFSRLTSVPSPQGKSIRQLVQLVQNHGDDWSDVLGEVARTRKPVRFNRQVRGIGDRWLEVYVFPTADQEKNLVGVLFHDITDRRHVDQELKETNTRLREIDKAKTAFFSHASHEFRTPLMLLLGPLDDLIKNGNLSEEIVKTLQLSLRNGIRLRKLVNTMLEFAKTEAGKVEAFYQPTDIVKLTVEIASNFRSLIEKAELKFIVKCQAVETLIYLNREMYEKILLNLISNAFKFTLAGKIEVTIKSRKKYVLLSVKDTGIGIAAADHEKIFEKFARVDGAKARTHEGSGIGLALVKDLVALHRGSIQVNSEEGRGSEFIIAIPKGKQHLPAKQIYETKDQLQSGEASLAYVEEARGWLPAHEQAVNFKTAKKDKRARIIVADDNADMREYMDTILGTDYQLVNVENGRKVIDFLAEGNSADLIVADVMMPMMDGQQLLHAIRRNPKTEHIPVILLSGHSTEEARIKGLNDGAQDYLSKPFSSEELKALVKSRLNGSTAHAETLSRIAEMKKRVTERTEQLRESETLIEKQNTNLRNILNAIPQMVWVLDAHCKIMFLNQRWYAYTGLTEMQCKSMNAKSCNIFHPSQEKEIEGKWAYLFSNLTRYVGETLVRSHTGEYRWYLDITEPIFNEAGELEMFVGTFTDMHEQFTSEKESKETKDLLQAVFDASTNAIVALDSICDDAGNIIDFKARYFNKKILQYLSESDLSKKTLREILREYDADVLYERLKTVVATGEPFQTEYKAGSQKIDRWFHLIAIKLGDGLVITKHDITEQIESRQQLIELNNSLKQKNLELKSMNEELTNFAFVSSHDLREPLRKIQLFTSGILSKDHDNLSESSVLYAQKVLLSVTRVNDLIEDILTYSKLTSYTRREHTLVDLNELLDEVLTELHDTIDEKKAKILADKLPSFTCNPLQITQLFQNIISNGLIFQTSEKTPVISVTGQIVAGQTINSPMADAALNYLKLEISDNGIGIEEQYLERIFGIFQRLHSHDVYPGTGIGLAICKKIAENHNGFIVAKSTVGEGSSFCCYFPVN